MRAKVNKSISSKQSDQTEETEYPVWLYNWNKSFAPKEQVFRRRRAKPESQKIREADENRDRIEMMRRRLQY